MEKHRLPAPSGWRPWPGGGWLVILVLLLLACGAGPGLAMDLPSARQPPLDLGAGEIPARLPGHMEIMRDPTGRMTLDDALTAPFRPVAGTPGVGYSTDAVWVRFRLRQSGAQPGRWFLEMQPGVIDHFAVFIANVDAPAESGDFTLQKVGASEPIGERPILYSSFLIPFDLPPGSLREVYVRIVSQTAISLRATIFDAASLTTAVSGRSMLYGLMYGAFFLCGFFNLICYLWLKDRSYLLYAGYVLSLMVNHLGITGTLVEVLPDSLAPTSKAWMAVSSLGVIVFGSLFVVRFLQLRRRMRWAGTLLYIVALLPVFYTTVLLLVDLRSATVMSQLIGLGSGALILWVSVRLAWTGDPLARRFLIAFTPAVLGGIMNTLRALGVVPNTWMSEQVYYLAGLVHVVLVNLSMMTRIRDAEAARHEAQAAALVASHVAEERALRIIEEQTRELTAAKREVEAALAAERQSVRDQLQFIDMIAHEYRTPMSVIRAGLDVMELRAGRLQASQDTLVTRMRRSADRLVELIEVGLRRDRIDQPGLAVERKVVDLATMAREVAEAATNEGAAVEVHADGPVLVEADLLLLRTVVVNLLENAIKYAPGCDAVRILVGCDGEWAALRVADRGPGIPLADRERIFDKFFRGSRTRTVPGVGLGLFLARRIVTLHGGTLTLEEADPGGCVFRLRIPSVAS